jgi:hypothetical protein
MVKKEIEKKEAWFRILVLIVTGIILTVWRSLIIILVIINWFIVLFSGRRNKELALFCEYWNTEWYKFIRYITFVSNKRPFPFSKMERISRFK